jgi:predicted helicase
MYRRFFRWAGDRIDDNGIIALVTNNNLIEDKEADGFRKVLAREFSEIWIVDLKGDARSSGERRVEIEDNCAWLSRFQDGVSWSWFFLLEGNIPEGGRAID